MFLQALDRDVHIEAIEKSFEEALETPVHPTDPSLTPVEVYDILPGLDLWQYQFVAFIYNLYISNPLNYYYCLDRDILYFHKILHLLKLFMIQI